MTLLPMLLLKSLLILALAALILLLLRRSSAAARSLVCLLTLGALLALPLFSVALPGWHLPVLSRVQEMKFAPVRQEPTPVRPSPALPVKEGEELSQQAHSAPAAPSVSSLTGRTPAKQGGGFLTPGSGFFVFYLLGLLLASVRPLLGLWGITRLSRDCTTLTDPQTLTLADACAHLLGLKTLPRLCHADVPVPMTWGWRRPVVVLPDAFADWPEDRLRSVLLHEMAHIKRRDWPAHRLADFACAVYWFHPLVWLTARRLRSETEIACDDLVLAAGIPAPDYARHLLEIASALPRVPGRSNAAIAMAQTSKIESRLTMILDKTRTRRAIARRVLLLALVPATAALVTLAVLRPDAKAQTTTPSLPTAIVPSPVSSSGTSVSTGVQISLPRNGLSLKMQTMTMRKSGIPVVSSDMTVNGTTLFAGATNPGKYGSQWWSASGALLPEPVYDRMPFHAANLGSADADAVSFAFRLPPAMQGVTVQYKLPQSTESSSDGTWPTKTQDSAGRTESQVFAGSGGTRIVTVGYPPELKTATIQVGMAAGAWTTAVDRVLNSSGVASANTTTNFSGQAFLVGDAAQTTKGTALTVSTNSQDDTRIIALDGHGKTLFPADIGDESTDSLKQITAHFSQPLSQIKEFRVETRPFQWIEFKDVALQPVK